MDQHQLISRCRLGDVNAYEALVLAYQDDLYRYCWHLTGESQQASDLFQDTWVKVMSKLHTYRMGTDFKNWLLSIASNTFKDHWRKQRRLQKILVANRDNEAHTKQMDSVADSHMGPEESAEQSWEREVVHRALEQMKPKNRMVLTLFYFEELSISEISNILSIPEGTVKSRLNQAKKKMKEHLEVMM